jgi:hypothetical protein
VMEYPRLLGSSSQVRVNACLAVSSSTSSQLETTHASRLDCYGVETPSVFSSDSGATWCHSSTTYSPLASTDRDDSSGSDFANFAFRGVCLQPLKLDSDSDLAFLTNSIAARAQAGRTLRAAAVSAADATDCAPPPTWMSCLATCLRRASVGTSSAARGAQVRI